MPKVNWSKALKEYILDETMSYEKIATKYGVSLTVVKQRASREGWVNLRAETLQKAIQSTQQKAIDTISEVNARHVNIGRMLQQEGVVAITQNNVKPVYFRDAREAIDSGVKIERTALGMDQKEAVNVNIDYKPPAWFTPPAVVESK